MELTAKPVQVHSYWDFYAKSKPRYVTSIKATWDLKRIGDISKKRIVKWLDQGHSRFSGGEAATVYNHLIDHFEIPKIVLPKEEARQKASWYNVDTIKFHNVSEEVLEKLQEMYASERVALRLNGDQHSERLYGWYFEDAELNPDKKQLMLVHTTDFTELKQAIAKMMENPEYSQRIEKAKEAVIKGAEISFEITKG